MSIPIEKDLDDIRTEVYAVLEAQQAADGLPRKLNLNRGPIRGIIELFCWGLYQLYLFLISILQQAFPSTATGAWLDIHCQQVGVTRKAATKAVGLVTLTRSQEGNIRIPSGKIFRTEANADGAIYRFVTTATVVLPADQQACTVPVEAEEYGKDGNVVAGMISIIVTPITGIAAVTNTAVWLTAEGRDRETDDELRPRYLLAWKSTNGCTKYAYQSWALGVSGVESVKVLDQHPRGQGTVDVIIKGVAGVPTESTLAEVAALVAVNKPINDDVEVKAPESVPVDIDISLTPYSAGDLDTAIADVTAAIESYFSETIDVGTSFSIQRLISIAMLDTVKSVIVTSPSADVVVGDAAIAVLQTVKVQ